MSILESIRKMKYQVHSNDVSKEIEKSEQKRQNSMSFKSLCMSSQI